MNFGDFVRRCHRAGKLVVQPRMGMSSPARMRAGLLATKNANATTVGTITLDSFTRNGDLASVERALRDGVGLNGYPIVHYDPDVTRAMLDGVMAADFPVQVRHGSARPLPIMKALAAAGLHATEGGPVSYCLPYGRTPLAESVRNWAACCAVLRDSVEGEPHVETFGGCMMGQLCPPSQLVALSVLEAMFFYQHGMRSISVSYAQQTSVAQDLEALAALRRLCAQLLPHARWHVVVYAYMGLYPRTPAGAMTLLGKAAELAVRSGSERLIVKTVAEAHRIPTIEENVSALEHAAAVAGGTVAHAPAREPDGGQVYAEAYTLVEAVLNCGSDIGAALSTAFRRGLLDVPYCVHPDNAGRTRSFIDTDGRLQWADIGSLPLSGVVGRRRSRSVTAADLMEALSHIQRVFDAEALEQANRRAL
ncbi:methylaspartate mutase [Thermoactinospora rubra]|uniref:methylaspartate mutase n=1 Tax=Thermoactinospora rubra TaxID=1088767 RepID=UPI000A110A3D|nr:methylaspartate mutase [Thermoactinospora rubra]